MQREVVKRWESVAQREREKFMRCTAEKCGLGQGIVCGEQWSGHLYGGQYKLSERYTLVNGFDVFVSRSDDDFKEPKLVPDYVKIRHHSICGSQVLSTGDNNGKFWVSTIRDKYYEFFKQCGEVLAKQHELTEQGVPINQQPKLPVPPVLKYYWGYSGN